MEKIAIKGSGGGGGGGTTFEIVASPTIVMSSTGYDGGLTLQSVLDVYSYYFNLIGGQVLGNPPFYTPTVEQASKSPYACSIFQGEINISFGSTSWDVGDYLELGVDIIDGEGTLLDTQILNVVGDEVITLTLQDWDGDMSNKSLSIVFYSNPDISYGYAYTEIGGWSFSIR